MTSPVVRENTAPPLDQDNLSLLLTTLGEPNQFKINLFVSTPATENLLQPISQLTPMNIEELLRDILDTETTVGLSKKELLGNACKTTLSTVMAEGP